MSSLSETAVERLRAIMEQPGPGEEDRYEIRALIGEGGMGSVYLAHDRELDRDVALKVLRDPAPSVEERERILREARILASLEHPGIVPIHDVGTLADGQLFYVMKRVRGERIDDFVRTPHSRTELLRSFLQLCDAVAFAHAAGVIHRDLKPQNVMLGAFGEVLVLDWGVARASRAPSPTIEPAAGTVAGTPGYMAPEQMSGVADERADVYGLGGLLFFLLTRQHPSAGTQADQQWPNGATVPSALRAICERARAHAPEARYQSVASIAADVANYLDALPVAAHTEGLVERTRRIALRHRTAILLVLAYLAMRIALLAFSRR